MKKWFTDNAVWVTALSTAVQAILLIATVLYAAQALREGNRVAWRTYLDTRASQLGLVVLDKEPLRCVTRYHLAVVENDCPSVVYDHKNVSQVVEYVTQELSILDEAESYAFSEDTTYYRDWYKDDADALAEDPTGVVSFTLWEFFSCSTQNDCYGCSKRNRDDCGLGARLGLCIAGEDFKVDQKHCFGNLTAKRQKFLDGVAKAQPITPKGG